MNFANISSAQASLFLQAPNTILIDVRETTEYQQEHISGAISVPLSTLDTHDFTQYTGKKVIIHCLMGGRGVKACEKIAGKCDSLLHLTGGLQAWKQAGYATIVAEGKKNIPLMQQVQITIGTMLILLALLSFLISKNFIILILLIGMGLIFSGLTGFCGLALLLAKMPWNHNK